MRRPHRQRCRAGLSWRSATPGETAPANAARFAAPYLLAIPFALPAVSQATGSGWLKNACRMW